MLFEISTAFRFLKPNRRELARSLICLLALGVITTICWLVIVFYSITEGLERRWIDQLVRLTGTVRLFPTSDYFNSYSFLVDSYSTKSNYQPQMLGYQLERKTVASRDEVTYDTASADPWDEEVDPPLPASLQSERQQHPWEGMAWLSERLGSSYAEVVAAPILSQVELDHWNIGPSHPEPQHLTWKSDQHATLLALEPWQKEAQALVTPMESVDARALWSSLEFLPPFVAKKLLSTLLSPQHIQGYSWRASLVPLLPRDATALTSLSSHSPSKTNVPEEPWQALSSFQWHLCNDEGEEITLYAANQQELDHLQQDPQMWQEYLISSNHASHHFLYTPGWNVEEVQIQTREASTGNSYSATWIHATIRSSKTHLSLQIPLYSIWPRELAKADKSQPSPVGLLSFENSDQPLSDGSPELPWAGVLAPKTLRDSGLHMGARLWLKREMMGPLGPFERQSRGVILGFYDPGIFPLGNRYLIAPYSFVKNFYEAREMNPQSNFIQMWPANSALFADQLRSDLEAHKMSDCFEVQSYEEFPFSRDLLTQMRSDRLLLSLIAMIILVVACSSIASMLVLLVNERRREIALFKALGMAGWRIILCFGLTGTLMGLLSAGLAISLAYVTLLHIDTLMAGLSYLHGQPLLGPQFYGQYLPREMSPYALKLVAYGSIGLSSLAGCLACLHGARMSPAEIMRSL